MVMRFRPGCIADYSPGVAGFKLCETEGKQLNLQYVRSCIKGESVNSAKS